MITAIVIWAACGCMNFGGYVNTPGRGSYFEAFLAFLLGPIVTLAFIGAFVAKRY